MLNLLSADVIFKLILRKVKSTLFDKLIAVLNNYYEGICTKHVRKKQCKIRAQAGTILLLLIKLLPSLQLHSTPYIWTTEVDLSHLFDVLSARDLTQTHSFIYKSNHEKMLPSSYNSTFGLPDPTLDTGESNHENMLPSSHT